METNFTPARNRIAGAVIVALFLVIASDFGPTADLSVAFAYLILISALLVLGPQALDNLSKLAEG